LDIRARSYTVDSLRPIGEGFATTNNAGIVLQNSMATSIIFS